MSWCCDESLISVSLHLILSVAYRIDRKREQKKEIHASLVEFRRPSPPNATGVDATNHAWSGLTRVAGALILIQCIV